MRRREGVGGLQRQGGRDAVGGREEGREGGRVEMRKRGTVLQIKGGMGGGRERGRKSISKGGREGREGGREG